MTASPTLTLQTGSLYASADASTFDGTGGPFGFSPFTSQFGGVVNSAGLDGEPFADTVYGVSAGDELIFVIAVQNRAAGAAAYGVTLHATMPTGFVVPPEGTNLSAIDGTGTDLSTTGDLFGPAGLVIGAPLTAYDPNSGQNLVLVTYALQAGPAVPALGTRLFSTASVLAVAATANGPNIPASLPAAVSTTVVTSAPTPVVRAESDPSALAPGQTVAFDTTVTVPGGTLGHLRLDTVLPAGVASLALVSTSVTAVGAGLQLGTPVIGTDGSVAFGSVVNVDPTGDDTITIHQVVRAQGTSSSTATLDDVLSADDPSSPGGRWSVNVGSSVGVVVPPPPPALTGVWSQQNATTTMTLQPFGRLGIADGSASETATLAVTLKDASLGTLGSASTGANAGTFDPVSGTYVVTGTLAQLQAAARALVFTPKAVGIEHFNLTLVDVSGGIAQDDSAAVTIAPSIDVDQLAPHYAPAAASQFLIATADGQQTLADGEAYQGTVSTLEYQYVYDGAQAVAILAQNPDVYVKNFTGTAAVGLVSGQNVVDAGKGSNFIVGGTGNDVFFLDARSDAVTWDTIVNFHAGDVVTVFGFQAGTSKDWWDDAAGAAGYQGRTLRIDRQGTGATTSSITFAATTQATTAAYTTSTGQLNGIDYMTIIAN